MQSEEPTIIQSLENHLAEYGHTTVGQDIAAAILVIKDLHQKAALSAQVQDVAGWQDISTAPRDGTTVLLYAQGWDSPKTGWTYGKDDWQDCPYSRSGDESYLPAYWMPLPTVPAAPAKQEG